MNRFAPFAAESAKFNCVARDTRGLLTGPRQHTTVCSSDFTAFKNAHAGQAKAGGQKSGLVFVLSKELASFGFGLEICTHARRTAVEWRSTEADLQPTESRLWT